jgi:hypothetical protein
VSHFFQLFLHQTLALVCASTSAFAPQPSAFISKELSASTPVIDNLASNLAVKNLWLNVESSAGLLTKVAKSGLISKAQEAGISLSKLKPLLQLTAGPEILPLLPTLFDLVPPVFLISALAISIPAPVIGATSLASAAAAFVAVGIIPDG